jgi:2'-5' RNA ligase
MNRFFIALLPPQHIQDYAQEIQQHFFDSYGSRGSQNSPPHITLQIPFIFKKEEISILETFLEDFANNQNSLPITLDGFGAFTPRVIYINVVKSQEILNLQSHLMNTLESSLGIIGKDGKNYGFTPHLTVARRDLKQDDFYAAWNDFEKREVYFEFTAFHLTLLLHDGKKWNVRSEFPLR